MNVSRCPFLVLLAVTQATVCLAQGGAVWTQLTTPSSPPGRFYHAMAYDAARERVVLFGGDPSGAGSALADTWLWDGLSRTWAQAGPAQSPPARNLHGMAYYAAPGRRRVVLFGGRDASQTMLSDTWEWDGSAWARAFPAQSPTIRTSHGMCTDCGGQGVVVFGGWNYLVGLLADTWVWNGTTWSQATPTWSPPAQRASMEYDAARERVVLFHRPQTGSTCATWEWNGTGWNLAMQSQSPNASGFMAFDAGRRRTVMFGGWNGTAWSQDTWEWDGSTWSQVTTPGQIPTRHSAAMAPDGPGQHLILFGGSGGLSDTWGLESQAPAAFVPYGNGCPGGLGDPALSAAPFSLPWTGDTFTVALDNLPVGSIPFLVFGFAQTSQPVPLLPGCTQLVTSDAAVPLPLVGSQATFSTPIPTDPAVVGWQYYLQGAALNAGGSNPLGGALSNGAEVTIGMR